MKNSNEFAKGIAWKLNEKIRIVAGFKHFDISDRKTMKVTERENWKQIRQKKLRF